MTNALRTAVAELEQLADTIDAKGAAVTPADLSALRSKSDEVKRLQVSRETGEAHMFMRSLSGTGSDVKALPRFESKAAWADDVAERVTKTAGEFGVKALSTGGIDIPSVVEPVVVKPVDPVRVLDLLINRKPLTGNEFEYLRQSVRTNNAAPVADNATKPTSVYTFEDESDRARVFAHLSEAIPLRYLEDHAEIKNVLSAQMAEDLMLALESDVLVGDGTGEHFTGIANVVGIQTQAFSTNRLTTLRKARTKLVKSGETPTAWVLNWDDLETLDLTVDGNENFMGGIDDKIFGNLPKIGSSVIPAGTAFLGDWNQSRLYVRDRGRLDADVSGELFTKNQVKLRYEGRFGFACLRPSAYVAVDLTA
jgi:HK97 family phage major capsid protein